MMWIQLQLLGVIALAMGLSALIGLEREASDKPAGLRTHMLVGGVAALLVGLSNILVESFAARTTSIGADPIRVIDAIVAGVTFLGAGTIIRRSTDDQTEGLTTAASLLFVAAIGVAVATYYFILAVGATLLALIILRLPHWLPNKIKAKELS